MNKSNKKLILMKIIKQHMIIIYMNRSKKTTKKLILMKKIK